MQKVWGGITSAENIYNKRDVAVASHTITGVSKGDMLIGLFLNYSSASQAWNKYSNASIDGGTGEVIGTLYDSNNTLTGSYYFIKCESDTVTVSFSSGTNCRANVFKLV